jgi:hypothetical protein
MPSPHMTALDTLNAHLGQNPIIGAILQRAPELQMPNWYLVAGCLAQTVWNGLHGFPAAQHIKDYDLVYFDATDTSYDGEDAYIRRSAHVFADLPAEIEIRNQARVHLWYAQHFGYPIRPYTSVEDAIDSWPTTATSLGITCDVRGERVVYAPFGLSDVLSMTVRPNKRQITEPIYLSKVNRWRTLWPKLHIMSWDEETG